MKILPKVIVGIFACAIGAGIIWYEWRQLNPPQQLVTSANPNTSDALPAANLAALNSPPTDAYSFPDDASAGNHTRFKDVIAKNVDDLVHEAEKEDVKTVAADEAKLPRSALPGLKDILDGGQLTAGAAKSIKAALDADSVRLKLAMEDKKCADWYQKNSLGVLDKNTPPGAPWRQSARIVMSAWARWIANDPNQTNDELIVIGGNAESAVKSGCLDPLFLYIFAKTNENNGTPAEKLVEAAHFAEKGMETSQYCDMFKIYAELWALRTMAVSQAGSDTQEVSRLTSLVIKQFPDAISDPDVPTDAIIGLFDSAGRASNLVYGDRRVLVSQLYDLLQKSKISRSVILTIKGNFDVDYAWDAKGNNIDSTNGPQVDERVKKADAALEEAWALDHSNKYAATEMIQVLAFQHGGRDQLELWFNRAVAADPEFMDAYDLKLDDLSPKWNGSMDEMVKFARQVSESAPPSSLRRIFIINGHKNASVYFENPGGGDFNPAYFRDNEAAWKDIHDAYQAYLPYHQDSRHDYLQYAQLAGWCGHWKESNSAFKQVPAEYYDWFVFETRNGQNQLREMAEQQVAQVAAVPASPPPGSMPSSQP